MKQPSRILALLLFAAVCASVAASSAPAQQPVPRYVVADQDAAGPGGSDMAALLVLLQSPQVHLLGVTVVTGDAWRDVEVAHALRLLELMGRTDVKVYPGAAYPLIRTQQWTRLASQLYGRVAYLGAWDDPDATHWDQVPALPEGMPTTRPADEDAAHFMVRMVHEHPHRVTIYAAGPLTNVALAIRLDPHFAELAQELVVMGGSLNPRTDAAEWADAPRHEFNLWFDPEAAHIVLTAKWPKITATTIDASIETRITPVLDNLSGAPSNAQSSASSGAQSNAARYLLRFTRRDGVYAYAWDELAAMTWLDPAITTRERFLYMDVNIDHGPSYGDVLTYSDADKPDLSLQKVHAQVDVDAARLVRDLTALFAAPTPGAHDAAPLPR